MLPISDRLAATRTEMANERTLLSYVRTALARHVAAFLEARGDDQERNAERAQR